MSKLIRLSVKGFIIGFVIGVILTLLFNRAQALEDNSRVPILLYHSWNVQEPCDRVNNDVKALQEDLEVIREEGYTVLPVSWIVQWYNGERAGYTLPSKVVGITVDDGYDLDFLDNIDTLHPCAPLKSVATTLREFRNKYQEELPEFSPHASLFVIGSKTARDLISPGSMNDNWWGAAQVSGLVEVYNHGMDHDHTNITEKTWEEEFNIFIPVSGYYDGIWEGKLRTERIANYQSNDYHVRLSARFIQSKIGDYPGLFAHPMGWASSYTNTTYFPNYVSQHGTVAAFCTESPNMYLTKQSYKYCLPRFTFGSNWKTTNQLRAILRGGYVK